jgi:uncharacterized membrane-anchored protein
MSESTTASKTHGNLLTDLHIKVPAVTAFFWIIKVLATTVGETFADYLNNTLGLTLTATSLLLAGYLLIALIAQFQARKYVAGIYWLVVILISVVGTLITDNLTDNFNVPLQTTTIIFAACLAITFFAWHRVEGTLSIHSIRTPRREIFYWLTILFTFALGTASGDLVNEKWATGYLRGLLLFGGLIALISLAFKFGKLNSVLTFWAVYVLTRPLGASLGDLLTQPKKVVEDGAFPGLGIDKYVVNSVFLALIVGLVVYLGVSKTDAISIDEFPDAVE